MSNKNEIDLSEFIRTLWDNKIFIIIVCIIFGVSSVIYALSLPNKYTSSSTLIISDTSSSTDGLGGMASQYGGLASLAGVRLPTSSSKDKLVLAEETIKSRDFMKILLGYENTLKNILAAADYDFSSNTIIYDDEIYDNKNDKWVYIPAVGQKIPPSYLEAHKEFVEKIVKVELDDETNFLKIEVEHVSPNYAFNLLNLIINELNETSREKDLAESNRALEYLENQLSITQQKDIRNSINKLIEAQLETQMLANIRNEYFLKPLDMPYIPEIKSSPGRAIICIVITFIGLILSIVAVLIRNYVSFKKNA